MSLRAKLLTGYAVFIAALIVLGAWSAWRLHEMGKVSRRIISENYDSVIAAQEMKESLERQDRARFDQNLQKAANNITEPGEPEAIEAISEIATSISVAQMRSRKTNSVPTASICSSSINAQCSLKRKRQRELRNSGFTAHC